MRAIHLRETEHVIEHQPSYIETLEARVRGLQADLVYEIGRRYQAEQLVSTNGECRRCADLRRNSHASTTSIWVWVDGNGCSTNA